MTSDHPVPKRDIGIGARLRSRPGCTEKRLVDSYDRGVILPEPTSRAARRQVLGAGRRGRAGRGRRRSVIAGIVIALLGWTGLAAYELVQAKDHAQSGLNQLRRAQRELDPAELIRGKGLPAMRAARSEFDRAADASGSVFLTPFTVLPFVGRQVQSVHALTGGASKVVNVGVRAMEQSTKELAAKTANGPERVALLERLGQIGRHASTDLRGVGLGPGKALIGPLADARVKFARQLRKAQRTMHDVDLASTGVAEMAKGPTKYLLLAANNGEMRAGSGMLLSAGVLTVNQGRFTLGQMVSVNDLTLPAGAVPLGGDFGARWGWVDPTQEWRYLAMSPQFNVTGSLAAQMWKAKTGEDVDGVLALDPIALRALVKVAGPVDVGGTQIDQGNVVEEILLQQYLDYPASVDGSEFDLPANDQRRERNGVIARAIVDQLDRVEWNIADLLDDLRGAARGRHVLFWSSEPTQQRAWRAAGVSGVLPRDGFMIAVQNRAGNKLDQFLSVATTIDHHRVSGGSQVTATINIANLTPATGLNRYVEGPFDETFAPGEYRGILAVNVPGYSGDIHLDGGELTVAAGPDGSTRVVGVNIRVLRGSVGTYTLRFTVPTGYEHLDVIPSARYPAIKYTAGTRQWDDDAPRAVNW